MDHSDDFTMERRIHLSFKNLAYDYAISMLENVKLRAEW